jgi:hypothetical protein
MVIRAFANLCPSAAILHTVTDIGMDCTGLDARCQWPMDGANARSEIFLKRS